MPNIKSSIRSVKTDAERRARNFAIRSTIKTVVRKTNESIATGNADEAKGLLIQAISTIDKAVSKGVIHKNTAARKKARLSHAVNCMAQ